MTLPLKRYDEAGYPDDRARTERLIAALRAGAELPPITVMIAPHGPPGVPVRVHDGFHRLTAHAACRRPTIRAHQLILPPGSPLLEPPIR